MWFFNWKSGKKNVVRCVTTVASYAMTDLTGVTHGCFFCGTDGKIVVHFKKCKRTEDLNSLTAQIEKILDWNRSNQLGN